MVRLPDEVGKPREGWRIASRLVQAHSGLQTSVHGRLFEGGQHGGSDYRGCQPLTFHPHGLRTLAIGQAWRNFLPGHLKTAFVERMRWAVSLAALKSAVCARLN